ncbi:MAG: hypothetical protein GX620_10655 [Chloroflexi bacterium]|nr:hypothetical protein [Chloroflexota bacterium]
MRSPRRRLSLSGDWLFTIDREEEGRDLGYFSPEYDDSDWMCTRVPGNWDTIVPELFGYSGLGWYRTTFSVDPGWHGRRVVIRFEGSNYATRVWLNGQDVGTHEGGFTPFEFDVTEAIEWDGANTLAVEVDNRACLGRIPNSLTGWWNYGGIYRDVVLCSIPALFIADTNVRAEPSLNGEGLLSVTITVDGEPPASDVGIHLRVACDGKAVDLQGDADATLRWGQACSFDVSWPGARLWSLESPTLYTLLVTLTDNLSGQIIDELPTTFGVRQFELRSDGFYLNGEPLVLKGVNRHEEYSGTGRVDPGGVLESDLLRIRELGCNMVRIHYPCEPSFYELTDRLGLLAFVEIPFWQIGNRELGEIGDPAVVAAAKRQISVMVSELRNHPSVAIWSVGNECASDTEEGRTTISELIDYTRKLDTTRPITYVSHKREECKCLDLGDFISLNEYYGLRLDDLRAMLEGVHRQQPHRVILMTEFGHEAVRGLLGTARGSEQQQAEVIARQWELFQSLDYIVGGLIWSWADYWHLPAGPQHRGMNQVYYCHGLLTLNRAPKLAVETVRGLFGGGGRHQTYRSA